MADGQLQLLVHHVGDFFNNYTADVFKMGIIRRHSKSALLAGMNLTMNANHDLDRFQSLACFNIQLVCRTLSAEGRRRRVWFPNCFV